MKIENNNIIKTKITDNLMISSVYREYIGVDFSRWAWETYLWEDDRVKDEYYVCNSEKEVLKLHSEIIEKYS